MTHKKLHLTFASNLSYLRMALGLKERKKPYSQVELAEMLNVTERTLVKWEQGHLPSGPNVRRIADFFSKRFGIKITPEDLLARDISQIIKITAEKEVEIHPEATGKLEKLKELELFLRGDEFAPEDIEKLIKIAEILKKEGEK